MKLRNKKTGEINLGDLHLDDFNSLAELNAEWEDYEEPKEYWYIDPDANIEYTSKDDEYDDEAKQIGNYFETKEEANKAVKRLRAWKRLKDKGFRFDSWKNDKEKYLGDFVIYASIKCLDDIVDDLNLLFGGEECILW